MAIWKRKPEIIITIEGKNMANLKTTKEVTTTELLAQLLAALIAGMKHASEVHGVSFEEIKALTISALDEAKPNDWKVE